MSGALKSRRQVRKLATLLWERRRVLIVMQDHPDPDAIAAAAALRELVRTISSATCTIAHGGIVGRAENRALVEYLGINLRSFDRLDMAGFDTIALVDTQPGTGNNSLPSNAIPDIVIDHHPIRRATRRVPFTDVRRGYGATSTILYEYLRAAGITPSARISTALFYGVWSDTQDLGRKCVQADVDAFLTLHKTANKRALRDIQYGKLPQAYFQMLANGLNEARVYGAGIISSLGHIDNPDMIGEVADLLLRNRDTHWALCYGFVNGRALFSIRTSHAMRDAGAIAHRISAGLGTGGGHMGFAGGQIPLKTNSRAEHARVGAMIVHRFLRLTRQHAHGVKLVQAHRQPKKGG